MAKEVGKIKESIKDIDRVERLVNFSIRGNSNEVPSSDKDLYQMMNDYSVYLSDKEFLEKWYDKKKFTGMHVDEEFDEFGGMEEFRVTENYYITFKDGSEIYVDFSVPDGDFMDAGIRDYEEAKGKLAEKWLPEFESRHGWNMDIDSLMKEVSGKKIEKGGTAGMGHLSIDEDESNMIISEAHQNNKVEKWISDRELIVWKDELFFNDKNKELVSWLEEFLQLGSLQPFGKMANGGKITPVDEGSWFDSSRGRYIGEAVIGTAKSYGFKVKPEDASNEKADGEHYEDLWIEAEEYLNKLAPSGYYFGSQPDTSDWGLWKTENDYGKGGKAGFKKCPVGTEMQSILFDKEKFTESEAKEWAKKHDKKYGDVDITENKIRLRQQEPDEFEKKSMRTIPLTTGVKAIIGCPVQKKGSGGEAKMEIEDKGNKFYLTKIDATHFYLSNNPDKKGEPYHIGQVKGEPYYDEVKKWISGAGASLDGTKKYKYSVTFRTITEESAQQGDWDDTGFEVEKEEAELQDIIKSARWDYGIINEGGQWSSVDPVMDRDRIEKGIEKYYDLFITHTDGSELSGDEQKAISDLIRGDKVRYDEDEKSWYEKGGKIKKGLYAEGELINGVIVVDVDKEFDDNPLFYIWSEYPTNKKLTKEGYLIYNSEFYTDKKGNKYLLISELQKAPANEVKDLIKEKKEKDPTWNWARNVDEFVEGADANAYNRWLDLISVNGGEQKVSTAFLEEYEEEHPNYQVLAYGDYWVLGSHKKTGKASYAYVPKGWIKKNGEWDGSMNFDLLSHVANPYKKIFENAIKDEFDVRLHDESGEYYEKIFEKMAKGGKIKNQYAGKSGQEVWDKMLEMPHRLHLLSDHKGRSPILMEASKRTGWASEFAKKNFMEMPDEIKELIEHHVHRGQYGKGGVANKSSDIFWLITGDIF